MKDARIRNTITGFTYSFGMAIFLSTLLDVLTVLADTSVQLGGMYAALYICAFGILCLAVVVYGEKQTINNNLWNKFRSIPNSVDDKSDGGEEKTDYIDSDDEHGNIELARYQN